MDERIAHGWLGIWIKPSDDAEEHTRGNSESKANNNGAGKCCG